MEDNKQTNQDLKEQIINATIALIENSDGLIENITIRAIAQKANVAVGLINYHFESKKNLIEVCVQRIISHVMATFPKNAEVESAPTPDDEPESEMPSFTARVFDFLLNHPEIARISILADLSEPNIASNSSVSYRAILKGLPETEDKKSEKNQKNKGFYAFIDHSFRVFKPSNQHRTSSLEPEQQGRLQRLSPPGDRNSEYPITDFEINAIA